MADNESTKQIVSRIDERTIGIMIDVGDMKKDLNRLNERTSKSERNIARIYGIGAAVVFIIVTGVAVLQVLF
ncbi:MAG: hypothetical protein MUP81_02265 [Dehalococcoidia bacterium]|nr:hypothetical protein [Dehalococcoidia bacterium]